MLIGNMAKKKTTKPKPTKSKTRRAWTNLTEEQTARGEKLQKKLGLHSESAVLSHALNRLADSEGV